jgi:hypothetical protein
MSPSLPLPQGGGCAFNACGDLVQGDGRRKWGYINWDLWFCGGSREWGLRNFVVFG